jgi:ankyrin repeat protein
MMKNTPMALALIRAGANVKKPDEYGMIPLTWAVQNCNAEVTQALVDAKSDVNFKRAGMTMMQEAGACPAAAAILKKAGAK